MRVEIEEQWAEVLSLVFLVLGFFVAIVMRNPWFGYASISLAGLLAGRIYYVKRLTEPILPFILIILGFLLGYVVGGFWLSRKLALLLFVGFFTLSYYLHLKEILVIFKSTKFLK